MLPRFDDRLSNQEQLGLPKNPHEAPQRAVEEQPTRSRFHEIGCELLLLFDSPTLGHAPLSDEEESLAAAMVRYWTQFAQSATPNSPATPFWPGYTVANDTYQSLVPPTPEPEAGFAADHKCAFWDSV
jgi:para-nitrobenzyl esterase